MKILKMVFPAILNLALSWVYKFLCFYYLENKLGFDYKIENCCDVVGMRFGVGWCSMFVMTALMVSTVAYILIKSARYVSQKKDFLWRNGAVVIVVLSDVLWMLHYIDWYLLPGYCLF